MVIEQVFVVKHSPLQERGSGKWGRPPSAIPEGEALQPLVYGR